MSKVPVIAFPEESLLAPLRSPTHPVVRYVRVLSRTTLLVTLVIFFIAKYMIGPALSTTLKGRFELQNSAYVQLKALHNRLRKSVKDPPSINVSYNGRTLVDRTVSSDDIIVEEMKQYQSEQFKKNSLGSLYKHHSTSDGSSKWVRFSDEAKLESDHSTFNELNCKTNHSSFRLTQSLQSLKDRLKELKVPEYSQLSDSGYSQGDRDMNSLLYQVRQFKTYLEVVTSDHPREMLFKKPLYHIKVGRDDDKVVKFNYLDILNDNLDNMKRVIDSR